jgi:hypothetical protein
MTLSAASIVALALALLTNQQEPKKANNDPAEQNRNHDYVRLSAEIRGMVEVQKDRVLVVVNQGGSCLFVYNDFWTLDFGKNGELKKLAQQLHLKTVIVTGEPERPLMLPTKVGIGGNGKEPPKLVINVKTLTPVPTK